MTMRTGIAWTPRPWSTDHAVVISPDPEAMVLGAVPDRDSRRARCGVPGSVPRPDAKPVVPVRDSPRVPVGARRANEEAEPVPSAAVDGLRLQAGPDRNRLPRARGIVVADRDGLRSARVAEE